MLLPFQQKEAVSPLKSEAAFLQSTHVALLPNVPFHPECSEETEAEGGKRANPFLMRGHAPGPWFRSV